MKTDARAAGKRSDSQPSRLEFHYPVDYARLGLSSKAMLLREVLPGEITIPTKNIERLLAAIENYRMDVLEHRGGDSYQLLDEAIEAIEAACTTEGHASERADGENNG